MTTDRDRLLNDVLGDLLKRVRLGPQWQAKFRTEATEYLEEMRSLPERWEVDLRRWAYDEWQRYETQARAEEQAAREAAEAPSRARRERQEGMWASPRNRPDAADLRQAIEARGIKAVYHWTEAENLESIVRHGLRSRHGQRALGLTPKTHGYGWAAREAEMAPFVGITLLPHEGMINRAEDPIVLELEPAVLAIDGALFVAGNSARHDIDVSDRRGLSTLAAFDSLFEGATGWLRDWQSEVWVPHYVSSKAITGVAARSAQTHARLLASWKSLFESWTYPPVLFETMAGNRNPMISIDQLDL